MGVVINLTSFRPKSKVGVATRIQTAESVLSTPRGSNAYTL
jgi:hypothetical protein